MPFSNNAKKVFRANGISINLFGYFSISAFINKGANLARTCFEQLQTAMQTLQKTREKTNFMLQISSKSKSNVFESFVESINISGKENLILLIIPIYRKYFPRFPQTQHIFSGFYNPKTHLTSFDDTKKQSIYLLTL